MTDSNPPDEANAARAVLPVPIPFIESLGVHLQEMAGSRALATMTPRPEHMNSWGVVHGGVLMTLMDFVMSMAGRSARAELQGTGTGADPGGHITVEMKTTFIRPGRGALSVRAHCLHLGRSLSFCEAEILNEEQEMVARASGTFKFWRYP